MLSDKGTNIFSEIGKFFKENDATSAMNAIMDTTKALRLSEKRLFGSESKWCRGGFLCARGKPCRSGVLQHR